MKHLLLIVFCGLSIVVKSQDASVEKSTFGVQVGFLGAWAHNELKLSNSLVLRTEVGIGNDLFGVISSKLYYQFSPTFTLEPRWYYNINKRQEKSKKIAGNTANFLSLKASYTADWFALSHTEGELIQNKVFFIPTWGIRRVVGSHLTLEAGAGLGYQYLFTNKNGSAALGLHLRVGYKF